MSKDKRLTAKEMQERDTMAIMGDEDSVTGFLIAGIGQGAGGKGTNFYICDKATTNQREVEKAFLEFTEVRKDIAILLITQGTAQHIRHLVDAHTAAVPAILEIPSKDAPYDPNQDSVMLRIQKKMNVGK